MKIPLRDSSIKQKLTLIIMAASTVALLLAAAGFVSYELFTFRQKMIRDLSTLADIIGSQSTAALSFDNKEDAEDDLDSLQANQRIVAACIYKGKCRFLRSTPGEPMSGCIQPLKKPARGLSGIIWFCSVKSFTKVRSSVLSM